MRLMRLSITAGVFCAAVSCASHSSSPQLLVAPLDSTYEGNQEIVSKALMEKVRKATERPVGSPTFRISQHVDYFPMRLGAVPVVPMSSLIEWTGSGGAPGKLFVIEYVDDLDLSKAVMNRAEEVKWNGRRLFWEREGHLNPGRYLWRIAVHDGNGEVFASAEQKIEIAVSQRASIEVSSVVVGKSCEEQVGPVNGLRRRTIVGHDDDVKPLSRIDPMRAVDCRIKPEVSDSFAPSDRLHAFVRIYPTEKLEKRGPASWTAKFVLRSKNTPIATEKETAFRADSGSGYLAYVVMSLDTPGMPPGQYTLDVVMRGPGFREELKESRSISIQPPVSAREKNAAVEIRKTH